MQNAGKGNFTAGNGSYIGGYFEDKVIIVLLCFHNPARTYPGRNYDGQAHGYGVLTWPNGLYHKSGRGGTLLLVLELNLTEL